MLIEGQEILEKRYKVIKKVGGGAFGEIYRGNRNHIIYSKKQFLFIILSFYLFKNLNFI